MPTAPARPPTSTAASLALNEPILNKKSEKRLNRYKHEACGYSHVVSEGVSEFVWFGVGEASPHRPPLQPPAQHYPHPLTLPPLTLTPLTLTPLTHPSHPPQHASNSRRINSYDAYIGEGARALITGGVESASPQMLYPMDVVNGGIPVHSRALELEKKAGPKPVSCQDQTQNTGRTNCNFFINQSNIVWIRLLEFYSCRL